MVDSAVEQELAAAFTLWAEADDAVRALVDQGLLQIRNSRDVSLARADVLLQAAIAAAEQVQDIRIDLLENPEGNYSSFVIEVLVVLAFETTIAGAILSKLSRALFSNLLASTAMAMRRRARARLAPSDLTRLRDRSKRLQLLRDLPRMRSGPERTNAIKQLTAMATDRSGKARQLLDGFVARKQVAPSVASDSRKALKAFHEGVRTLAKGGADVSENLQGAAQTGIVLLQPPKARAPLSEADSPGVRLLTDIQAYASRLRLTIQLVHNQLEKWMSDQLLEPDTEAFVEILDVCTYRDVRADGEGDIQRIDDDLKVMRDQYRLLFEGVIWAFLFGFRRPRSAKERERPELVREGLDNVKKELMEYWAGRFGPRIDELNALPSSPFRRYSGKFKDLSRKEQASLLRDYFWLVMDSVLELEKLYAGDPTTVELGHWW